MLDQLRRRFMALLGGAAAWPFATRAQQRERIRKIGVLMAGADEGIYLSRLAAFRRTLQELGWAEGSSLQFDLRWDGSDMARIAVLAEELVQSRPDVLLVGPTVALLPLQKATQTIPIVFVQVSDPHHGNDRDLRQFAGAFQPSVEDLEHRVPVAGAHRRHVEHVTNGRTTAPDTALTFERATLESIGRNADQGSDLLAAHAAELGQERNQRASQQRSDTRHRGEQPVAMAECGITRNNLDQVLIERVDVGCEPCDAAAGKTLQHRVFQQSGRRWS
jgi:hypothetical protein